jgi:murein L,D-transpeptidase YcbB/YkuD
MFPNKFNVYLHDTPSHILFGRTNRTFSHGCIRVGRPAELAAYILGKDQEGWDLDRIRKIISSGKRTVVRLKKPLPVHILYRTALVDMEGNVLFRNDVYGRDKLLEKALF